MNRSNRWLGLAGLLLAGCGAEIDDGLGGDFPPTEPRAPEVADAGPPDAAPDAGPGSDAAVDVDTYTGTWAHVQIQRGLAILPVLGAEPTTTYGVMRLEIAPGPTAGALALSMRICEVRIERERDVVVTSIPPSFIDALDPIERPATFDGAAFEAPWFTELRGVRLDAPDTDPLPTEADDPRVLDPDADGHPGLTARVSGLVDGEVYLVQRTRTRLSGTVNVFGLLDGGLEWTAEESVLGADDPLLVDGAPFEVDPADPDASEFRSTRIEPDQDCDWIVDNQTLLFAR